MMTLAISSTDRENLSKVFYLCNKKLAIDPAVPMNYAAQHIRSPMACWANEPPSSAAAAVPAAIAPARLLGGRSGGGRARQRDASEARCREGMGMVGLARAQRPWPRARCVYPSGETQRASGGSSADDQKAYATPSKPEALAPPTQC